MIAQLLIAEGFSTVREISETPIEEMTEIEGFDEDIGQELINRANAWIEEQENVLKSKKEELGINEDLMNFEGLTPEVVIKLAENDVKSRDDLADLATDELVEILGEDNIKERDAEKLIMKAREHWFAEEDAQKAKTEAANTDDATQDTAEETPAATASNA